MKLPDQRQLRRSGAILNGVGSALLNALFPVRCAGCDRFRSPPRRLAQVMERTAQLLKADSQGEASGPSAGGSPQDLAANAARGVRDNWFCPACRESYTWVSSPLCTVCGRMFPSRRGRDHPCAACTRRPPPYNRARACGVYGGSLKAAIQKLKYRGQVQWADPLGLLLYLTAWSNGFLEQCRVILPVPLHPSRLRQRGFNQVCLMLRQWPAYARRLGPTSHLPAVDPRLLRRRRPTAPQTGLDPQARRANVRGAFQIEDPRGIVQGRRILLVDDVLTTGATAGACAEMLKSRGRAGGVDVLTLAGSS